MTPCQDQDPPPWADLLPELLVMVFLRLPTRADRARFPAVCRHWGSAAQQGAVLPLPLPSPMPWLVVPHGSAISFPHGETFHLPQGTCYHNSYGEWIFLSREDETCFLMNPFTKATVSIPKLSSYRPYYEPVETVNDRMVPEYEMDGTWMEYIDSGDEDISVVTLIVCSTRLVAAIVAVDEYGRAPGTIALCRPGATAWSVSAHEQCRCLADMVFLQGKLYAIGFFTEDLLAIDIVDEHGDGEPKLSRIERIIEGAPVPHPQYFHQMRYLLESHGTLLMIRRNISTTTEPGFRRNSLLLVAGSNTFEVLRADFGCSLWAGMISLGADLALFLGRGCSSVVCVSPHDLSRDCIFFLDDYTHEYYWKKTTTSCSVYDMKDGKAYSPLPTVSWRSGKVPATWLFSQGNMD